MDTIFKEVFNLYDKGQWEAELIARVPQMMLQYPDGLRRLEQQAPLLLSYYQEIFLSEVESHCELLESRALSSWPKSLFDQAVSSESDFSLARVSPRR